MKRLFAPLAVVLALCSISHAEPIGLSQLTPRGTPAGTDLIPDLPAGAGRLQALQVSQLQTFLSGVASVNGRTGAVAILNADVTGALGYTPLGAINNLSDLSNVATARNNLGLGYFATGTSAANLTGTVPCAQLPSFSGGASNSGCAISLNAVTSVALSDASTSPIYTISGSPVTSTGTLTETLATQTKNTIFAGPTSGSAAQPAFRPEVIADLPFSGTPSSTTYARGDGTWATPNSGGTPGGSNTQVQYNNSGAFGGIADGTSVQALIGNGASSTPSFQNMTRVFVGSYTVSGSSTSQVASSSLTGGIGIPSSGYNNLIIRVIGRTLNSADNSGNANVVLQINGDSTTGHYASSIYGNFDSSGTLQGTVSAISNGAYIGSLSNSYNGNTAISVNESTIYNYNQSANSVPIMGTFFAVGGGSTGSNGPRRGIVASNYTPSAAITSFQITFYNDALNATANAAAGTLIEVYAEQ